MYFTPLPIPAHVINRVHELAKANNQNPALHFFDHLGSPLDNDDTPEDDDNTSSLAGVENENEDRNGERNENELETISMRFLMRISQAATTLHKSMTNLTTTTSTHQEWRSQE